MRTYEFATCFDCNVEMNGETRSGVLYLKCPECGRKMKAADWYPEYYDMDGDNDEEGEFLSVYETALLWASNGEDEDYTFGYNGEKLDETLLNRNIGKYDKLCECVSLSTF